VTTHVNAAGVWLLGAAVRALGGFCPAQPCLVVFDYVFVLADGQSLLASGVVSCDSLEYKQLMCHHSDMGHLCKNTSCLETRKRVISIMHASHSVERHTTCCTHSVGARQYSI
jgi:hypothetical protein